jgi:hypothetical protein
MHTDIHALNGIATHVPRVWAGKDGSYLKLFKTQKIVQTSVIDILTEKKNKKPSHGTEVHSKVMEK